MFGGVKLPARGQPEPNQSHEFSAPSRWVSLYDQDNQCDVPDSIGGNASSESCQPARDAQKARSASISVDGGAPHSLRTPIDVSGQIPVVLKPATVGEISMSMEVSAGWLVRG